MGGTRDPEINSMSNLVSLCVQCHKWITEHPAESYETGWSIRRSSGHVPEEVPLTDAWGYQFFLTSDGGVVRIGNINRSKP